MWLADEKLDLSNKLDNDLFNHIAYVSNKCLLLMRDEGVSKDTLVEAGKYLWRLFRVIQAYNHKRREPSLREAVDIVLEFKSVILGE